MLLHLMREHAETGELMEIGTATGFLVNASDGYHLVTNWHVLTGYAPDDGGPAGSSAAPPTFVDIDFHNPDDLQRPATHRYPLYEVGRPRWRVHSSLDSHVDIAALTVDFGGTFALHPGRAVHLQGYELDYQYEMKLEPSMDVSVIGYPYGRRSAGSLGIWVRGTVASEPELDFEGDPIFLIDCRSRLPIGRRAGASREWTHDRSRERGLAAAGRLLWAYQRAIRYRKSLEAECPSRGRGRGSTRRVRVLLRGASTCLTCSRRPLLPPQPARASTAWFHRWCGASRVAKPAVCGPGCPSGAAGEDLVAGKPDVLVGRAVWDPAFAPVMHWRVGSRSTAQAARGGCR